MAEIPIKPEDCDRNWLKNTLTKSLKSEVDVIELKPVKTEGYLSKAFKATIKGVIFWDKQIQRLCLTPNFEKIITQYVEHESNKHQKDMKNTIVALK